MMNFLTQDVFFATRQLRKSPSFTAAAILTLALGIGANLTVFLILYGVLLRPLPFPQPQQLVRINRFYPVLHDMVAPAYSGTKILFMSRANRTIESAAAYGYFPNHVNLVQGDQAVPLESLGVTSEFFRVFQMEPRMGRGFLLSDMTPHSSGVAVLSDAAWRLHFGSASNIVGKSINLGNRQYTVIGVANPDFHLDAKVDVWTPLQITESPEDQNNQYNFVGRLKPGVTVTQAQDDLRGVLLRLRSTYPNLWNQYESVRVIDYHDSLVGQVRPALEMLVGAVGLVLVIVSANILSLLLTRSIARRREMGLRAALGATGWRIVRQLLVENAILCFLGGVTGILFAEIATPLLMHVSPLELPDFASLHIGGSALFFVAALMLACAFVFSLVPAMESRRTRLNESLRMNSAQITTGRNAAQKSLVVSEVAISLVLMVAAGLLLSSFWKLVHTSPGFAVKRVMTFKTTFSDEQAATSAGLAQRTNELVARLEALPGVESAAATNSLPTQRVTPDLPFEIFGRPANDPNAKGDEQYIPVTAHFFDSMHIPVVAGRGFRLSDTHGTLPVLVINEQFARTYFKGENPIGQHIRIGAAMGPGFEDALREIVGVVGDTKNSGLDRPAPGILYLPAAQVPDALTQMGNHTLGLSWVVSTKSGQVDVANGARRIFMDNARVPLLSVESMQDVIGASVAQQQFTMMLLGCFGLISLLLGGAGLYGVMSYAVARRTKEIAVRMAIGADRGNILRMVLREAGLLVSFGLVIGIAASVASAQLLRSLLFGVAPRDPLMLGAMCGVLLLTGLFAAWWPALRAASTEPMQALRME
jgi:predicted permease